MNSGKYKPIHHKQSTEEIPLENISIVQNDDSTVADGDQGYQSDGSATSHIFDDINTYSQSVAGEENFEDDAKFQLQWTNFKTGNRSNNLIISLTGAFFILIWAIFLVVYSHGNARQKAAEIWHGPSTNIISLSNRNVTLNAFNPAHKNVSFTDYRKNQYLPSFKSIRWLNTAQFPVARDESVKGYYATRRDGKIVVLSADSNYEHTLLDSNQFLYGNKFYYAKDVILNPGDHVDNVDAVHLIRSDPVAQWRHSSFSLFWLWVPVRGEVVPVQPPQWDDNPKNLKKLHFAKFDPAGKHLLFGFEHDLFIMDVHTHNITAITSNGSPDIFNGKPDWVYEEEVYPQESMVWWNPNLSMVVYAQINDTLVQDYNMDYYVKDNGEAAMSYEDLNERESAKDIQLDVNQYPKHTSVKYPKAGTHNPTVRLFSYTVESGSLQEITGLIDDTVNDDFILYDAAWIDASNMLLKVSDRFSSVQEKKIFSPSKDHNAEIVSVLHASDFSGWFEKAAAITLVKKHDSVQYLDRVVVDGVVQLALYELAGAKNYSKLLGPVTYGTPLSYDELEDCIYGIFGTNLNANVALVSLENGTKTILAPDGAYGLNFSPNGQFLDIRYEGPQQPWQKIAHLALIAEHPDLIPNIAAVDDSTHLSDVLKETNIPTKVLSSVKVGKKGENINMIEIFPPNFNHDEKHPLLVHVYGGPGSTTVTKAFGIDFQDIVSSHLNAVVLIIDPRGTGSDDWSLKSHLKGQMGKLEPQDITSVAKDYIKANKYIDDQKTAIWGWSYGGFTTLKTLEFDKGQVFKYGMAVAPVTNWLFYDSVFTERIMGSPAENPNYKDFSRINEFGNFKEVKRFLVMQGTADDNVHMQNSLWLLDNFNREGVENYDVHFFPDSDHSIYFHNANTIVFDKLFWWLEKAYGGFFI